MDVYTRTAVDETAVDAVAAWCAANNRCVWLYGEAETGVELARFAAGNWRLWPHGRAFGEEVELAWWLEADGRYQLRLCLETGGPPAVSGVTWGSPEIWHLRDSAATKTLLHGSYDVEGSQTIGQGSWSEARIPRWLHYPLDVDPAEPKPEEVRAVLLTQPYNRQDGLAIMTRLVGLGKWRPTPPEEVANGQ